MFAFIIQVFSSVRDSLFSIKGLSKNIWISWNIFIAGFLKIWHHLLHKLNCCWMFCTCCLSTFVSGALSSDVVYFWGVSSRKNICYIVKPCREIGQSFEESLQEGKLVYNKLEILWMTNRTIIEFGFRKMKRIMQILEDVFHLGR